MAGTVRELVVTLSLEAGTFSKTCKDINDQIKGVQAEFNAITAGVDGWQTTITGRKAKLDALTETLTLQQAKITTIATELGKANTALAADPGNLGAAKKVSSLEAQLNNATAAAKSTKLEIEKLNAISLAALGTTLTTFGNNLKTFGRKFSLYIGGPLAALGVKSYNAALDYESALVSMQKTVEETDATKYQDISDAFLEMSETGPMSYTELMELGGQAGAYGVLADNIVKTVKSVAMLKATADDLDASTGLGQLTQLMNITERGDYTYIENVSSSLTDLGNKMNATEAQILEMAQRMAATGELAGIETTQILALAAGFTSVGINAEAGGAAAGKLMKKMQLAAEVGGKAVIEFSKNADTAGMSIRDMQLAADDPKWVTGIAAGMDKTKAEVKKMIDSMVGLQQFSDVMGISTEKFVSKWNIESGKAMLDFFDGLSKIEKSQGESTILSKLDEMGLTEIRTSNLIAAAATNPELFKKAFVIADEAYKVNTALSIEAEKRYATAESRQQTQMNIMENASADVGENVVDAVQPIIDKVTSLVSEFGKLDEATQTRWVTIAGALIVLGPAAMGIGSVAKGVGGMVGHLAKLTPEGVTNWSKLLGFFSSPVGMGLSALAIGTAAGVLLGMATSADTIRADLENIPITVDETKKQEALNAIAEVQAAADKLSGAELEAAYGGTGEAVKAGYGTIAMFGTSIGYEAELAEREIADASAIYSAAIANYNAQIVTAVEKGDETLAASLALSRDTTQTEWDTSIDKIKTGFTLMISDLIDGMMKAQPEAAAKLEQIAKEYDLLTTLQNAMNLNNEDAWREAFTPDMMAKYLPNIADFSSIPLGQWDAVGLGVIEKLRTSITDGIKTADKGGLAYTLMSTLMSDPGSLELLDVTQVQGVLDGIIEGLDFKSAEGQGENLTKGLADGAIKNAAIVMPTAMNDIKAKTLTALQAAFEMQSPSRLMQREGLNIPSGIALGVLQGIPQAVMAMNALGVAMEVVARSRALSVSAAFNDNLNFMVGSAVSANIARLRKALMELEVRTNRGYGSTQ